MKKKETIKYFNGERYYISQKRWRQRTRDKNLLSHDVWNFYNPDNRIEVKDEFVIHHINQKPNDDRIENLEKIERKKHSSIHSSGENNPAWKSGASLDMKKYHKEYDKSYCNAYNKKYRVQRILFSMYDKENHFNYQDIINVNKKKTGYITILRGWRYY